MILATLALVVANAYFVAAEFASVSARSSRLELAAKESLFAKIALDVKKRLDLYLSSCQLGVTLASLGLGAVTEPAVAGVISPVLNLFHLSEHPTHVRSFVAGQGGRRSPHHGVRVPDPQTWAGRRGGPP